MADFPKIIKSVSTQGAENEWSASADESGVLTITHRAIGEVSALASVLSTFKDAIGTLTALPAGAPFSGSYYASSASLSTENFLNGVLERRWTDVLKVDATGGGGGITDGSITATLSTTTTTLPIESAPALIALYDELQRAVLWKYAQLYIDAASESEMEEVLTKAEQQGVDRENIQLASSYRIAGVSGYLAPAPKYTQTTRSKTRFSGVGANIGKIGAPSSVLSGFSLPEGYEWLKTNDTMSGDGETYTRTEEWTGAKKWDEFLYGSAS